MSSCSVTPSPGPSPHPIIPPIITSEKDREFLITLNSDIDRELCKIDRNDEEQRYIVYKAAFDRIIEYVTAYKMLLTDIKAEYEDFIGTIQRGQREAFFLSGKLKAIANEPSTIRNYRKRGDELEDKLEIIQDDNERLLRQLNEIREARQEKERKSKEVAEVPQKVVKRDSRPIPGLSTQQSTDLIVLNKELAKLEKQLKDLSISYKSRYSPKGLKENMKEQLSQKVCLRDELVDKTDLLKHKRHKLKVAVEAAQAYMKIQPPHQSIGDVVVNALNKASHQFYIDKGAQAEEGMQRGTPSTTFEEDDPSKEKEAEMMLEYIEKFNELLEDYKYEEAAIHAANSPKAILRTPETLNRFKEGLPYANESGRSPLLAFCDALMATVPAYGIRPPEVMSLECVRCALDENKLDLLGHWIAQDRLTMTEQLGNMIYDMAEVKPQSQQICLALAQHVYFEIEAHVPALVCMVRQGRVNQALEYAQKAHMVYDDFVKVLQKSPTPQMLHALYDRRITGRSIVPLGMIVSTLLNTPACNAALQLLQDIYTAGAQDGSHDSTALRQAVFDDEVTSSEQWLEIVQKCHERDYDDAAIDILAAVTVLTAVKRAALHNAEIEREKERKRREEKRRVEEEQQRILREAKQKEQKHKKDRKKKKVPTATLRTTA